MKPEIQRIPAVRIDAAKWDCCVQQHNNGLLYSTSTYLNALCENWEGIIVNDYEAIVALPIKKNGGYAMPIYLPLYNNWESLDK